MTVLWKKHVYRAFKIYTMLQRKLKHCSIPYPWIAKNVIEYISIAGVAEEENIINFKARYDFLFSGIFQIDVAPGFPVMLSVWMTHLWLF